MTLEESMTAKRLWLHEQAKRLSRGAVLLYKVGDFYELRYEDAKVGEEVLGLRQVDGVASFPNWQRYQQVELLVSAGHLVATVEPGRLPVMVP